MSLRLVRDEPKKPRVKLRHHQARLLSADEQRRARQALKNLRDAFATYGCLAAAMSVPYRTVWRAASGKIPVSAALLVRASLASGLSIAELLGKPIPADRCRACGQIKRRAA